MIMRTTVFELCDGHYSNLTELARAMGLSVSQVYRVREGRRSINHKFIIGAKKAFPACKLDDLFYFEPEPSTEIMSEPVVTSRYMHIVKQYVGADFPNL